jgi:hypothetical protein
MLLAGGCHMRLAFGYQALLSKGINSVCGLLVNMHQSEQAKSVVGLCSMCSIRSICSMCSMWHVQHMQQHVASLAGNPTLHINDKRERKGSIASYVLLLRYGTALALRLLLRAVNTALTHGKTTVSLVVLLRRNDCSQQADRASECTSSMFVFAAQHLLLLLAIVDVCSE